MLLQNVSGNSNERANSQINSERAAFITRTRPHVFGFIAASLVRHSFGGAAF
jgi:hypothetical protein